MRVEGRIVQWDDAKGYGFIAPSDGGPKRFAHLSAFGLRPRRPFVGERVSFEAGSDAQGKPRALKIRSLEPKPAPGSIVPYLLLWEQPTAQRASPAALLKRITLSRNLNVAKGVVVKLSSYDYKKHKMGS